MEIFLKSCAYGTAAGALLGLASLAVSEDPSANRGNVARGASLGLYAGIGFGLYTLYGLPATGSNEYGKFESLQHKQQVPFHFWFSTIQRGQKIEGAQLNWASYSF